MSWTEERIDLLTRLWGEGRSASQIASELGGVTRNAVIGKVHRLKLDNRPKSGGADELEPENETSAEILVEPTVAPERPVLVEVPPVSKEPVAPAPPAMPRILPAQPTAVPVPAVAKAPSMPLRSPVIHSVMGATALKMEPEEEIEIEEPTRVETGEVVPISRNLTLVQLSERTCKWPLGDPLSADFRFCGNHSHDASPYCRYHAKLAFQPASERRRIR